MTRDEILNMPAGREMDALIAEKVMRLQKTKEAGWYWISGMYEELPYYSIDIALAWQIAEKLSDKFDFALVNNQNFSKYPELPYGFRLQALDESSHIKTIFALGDSAPLAICRAALLTTLEDE